MSFQETLHKVLSGENLSEFEMMNAMTQVMEGKVGDAQLAAFLTALQLKHETVPEIVGAARVMRAKAEKAKVQATHIVDTCGTGGDGADTFNISTAVAFVLAGAEVTVAKHGNRGVSSKSGSSDVLKALGVNIMLERDRVKACLSEVGMAFLFAPLYHPILKNVADIRKKIGTRTIFNILGPLLNPASVRCQLIGVYDFNLAESICKVMRDNGSKRVMVVHGSNGADEVTTIGITKVCELNNGEIKFWEFDPESVGLSNNSHNDLVGKDPIYNAGRIIDLLEGKKSAFYDNVVLNAAFVIYLSGMKSSLQTAIIYASDLIDSGRSMQKLVQLKEFR